MAFLDNTGLNYLATKIKTLLVSKADKNLSNVTDSDFLKKATTAGIAKKDLSNVENSVLSEKIEQSGFSAGQIFTGVLGTTWTEDDATGVKYQDVTIEGIKATHNGNVDHDDTSINGTSEGYATFVEEENQWLTYITNGRPAQTFDGYVRFEIFGDPNTVEIPFRAEVS